MGVVGENFDISWNNFESRLCHSFADIWGQEQFFDVTLTAEAEDGSMEALRAHKVILSAASPVLRSLLERQSALAVPLHSPSVMLYLQSISARHLGLILEFIYRGRVSLPQEELNDFLGVAKSLQIPLEDIDDRPASPPAKRSAKDPGEEAERIKRPKLTMGPKSRTKPKEVVKVKENLPKRDPKTPPSSPPDSEEVYEVVEEDGCEDPLTGSGGPIMCDPSKTSAMKDTFISENVTETDEGGFLCRPCEKVLTTKGGVARHVEDLHVMAGMRYQCPKCPYIAKNKNCLGSHVSRRHREIARGLNYEQCVLYRQE